MNNAATNRSHIILVVTLLASTLFLPAAIGNWFGARILELTVPVSAPLKRLVTSIRGAPEHVDGHSPQIEQMRVEIESLRVRNANLEARSAAMADQLERLQSLRAIDPTFFFVTASRVADPIHGGDPQFVVNVGSRHGVRQGTLAMHNGFQVVGLVTATTPRTATITPLTSKAVGEISAYVLPPDGDFAQAVPCTLRAGDDGTLIGEIGMDRAVSVGDRVILRDPHWSQLRTGPLIGSVMKLAPKDDAPLWNNIVVRSSIDLDEVAVVDLKVARVEPGDDQ